MEMTMAEKAKSRDDPNDPFSRFANVYVEEDENADFTPALFQDIDDPNAPPSAGALAAAAAASGKAGAGDGARGARRHAPRHKKKRPAGVDEKATEDDVAVAIRRTITATEQQGGGPQAARPGLARAAAEARSQTVMFLALFVLCALATVVALVAKPAGDGPAGLALVLVGLAFCGGCGGTAVYKGLTYMRLREHMSAAGVAAQQPSKRKGTAAAAAAAGDASSSLAAVASATTNGTTASEQRSSSKRKPKRPAQETPAERIARIKAKRR